MNSRTYWLNLFSGTTRGEFLASGAEVSGFREGRWSSVQQIKQGDYLLCYLTGASRFIGVLEVVSDPYWDETPIWKDAQFPCRVRVKEIVRLEPDTAVPITQLREQLSIFQNARSPRSWEGYVRGSPVKWKASDGELVVNALTEALQDPVSRPVDPARLDRRHRLLKKGIRTAAPSSENVRVIAENSTTKAYETDHEAEQEVLESRKSATAHTEIQWLLLKLGSDMSYDVWVARNDRGRDANGQRFVDLPRLKKDLYLRFDERVNQTIEMIDVLWLKGNSIVAAFEIESTTSIYSGLLRMSDLIAMQPNLSIPLYLVAPDERREKVIAELTRPTVSRLSPPLHRISRYIPFNGLRKHIANAGPYIRFMTTDFLQVLSEEIEER